MAQLLITSPILCSITLAAHFLREQNAVLVLVSISSILFLFIRNRRIVKALQVFYVLAGLEWIHSMVVLAMQRRTLGSDWMRMALIMSAVAVLTLLSAWIVGHRGIKGQEPYL
jgi:hypothetical protein